MSLLLDALRKSANQRRLGTTPGLEEGIRQAPRPAPRRRSWLTPVLFVAIIALLLIWQPWREFGQETGDDAANGLVDNQADNNTAASSRSDSGAPIKSPITSLGDGRDADQSEMQSASLNAATSGAAVMDAYTGGRSSQVTPPHKTYTRASRHSAATSDEAPIAPGKVPDPVNLDPRLAEKPVANDPNTYQNESYAVRPYYNNKKGEAGLANDPANDDYYDEFDDEFDDQWMDEDVDPEVAAMLREGEDEFFEDEWPDDQLPGTLPAYNASVADAPAALPAKVKSRTAKVNRPIKQEPSRPVAADNNGLKDALGVLSYYDLPVDVRAAIPDFDIQIRVYDEDPERRFLVTDQGRLREGDELADSLALNEIRRDGVVLSYRNYLFLWDKR